MTTISKAPSTSRPYAVGITAERVQGTATAQLIALLHALHHAEEENTMLDHKLNAAATVPLFTDEPCGTELPDTAMLDAVDRWLCDMGTEEVVDSFAWDSG